MTPHVYQSNVRSPLRALESPRACGIQGGCASPPWRYATVLSISDAVDELPVESEPGEMEDLVATDDTGDEHRIAQRG